MCWEMCLWCKQIIFGQIIAIQYNVPFSCFWIKGWLPLTSIKQGSPENQQEKHNLKWERESKAVKDSSLLPTNSQKKFQFEESDKHAWQWGLQRTWFFFFSLFLLLLWVCVWSMKGHIFAARSYSHLRVRICKIA